MLFERRCPGCGTPASSACSRCLVRLGAARPARPALDRCAGGLGLDGLVALWTYGAAARAMVLAAKNGRRRDLCHAWAGPLATEAGILPDLVTWVPADRARRRRRGYDQGQVLGRRVASELGVGSRRMLVRRPAGAPAARGRLERIEGPGLAATRRSPRRVLVIDDVLTTGGSLAAAATALRAAGAEEVVAAVLAAVVERGEVGAVDRFTGEASPHVRTTPGARYR